MIPQTGTILCIESDDALRLSRCHVLTVAGYTAVSACPSTALKILADRVFDIIVTSGLSDQELVPIYNAADGAEILALSEFTLPTLLLFHVDERLRQLRHANKQL